MQAPVFFTEIFVEEFGQRRVGDGNPATRGHAVGDVGEAVGEDFGKV